MSKLKSYDIVIKYKDNDEAEEVKECNFSFRSPTIFERKHIGQTFSIALNGQMKPLSDTKELYNVMLSYLESTDLIPGRNPGLKYSETDFEAMESKVGGAFEAAFSKFVQQVFSAGDKEKKSLVLS